MSNPILVHVTRGSKIESFHRGAFVVSNADGDVLASAGDIAASVYPRSAVKAFQALPLLESGAADAYGFTQAEIALACSSHSGEADHVTAAGSMLKKAGFTEKDLECGAHWPFAQDADRALAIAGKEPSALHNNCSGKHAGMLASAKYIGAVTRGYTAMDHPVQREVAAVMGGLCGCDLTSAPCAVDGCSVPTWAIPLKNLALGFARLATPACLTSERAESAARIFAAAAAEPQMVAGTKRFCTEVMRAVPRAFVKTGAEGVFCGCVPHAGIGIALKCDDGTTRASEAMMAAILSRLAVFTADERALLEGLSVTPVLTRRGVQVGDVTAAAEPFEAVRSVSP